MQIDEIVARYIQLRDRKKVLKDAYEASVAEIDSGMDRIERALMVKMQEQGLKSMPTSAGTAYLQTRTSATVADWDTTLGYIQANELWTLLEKRVNKTAVEEFRAANDDLPPGINWREELVCNIRRS
jgi:hypothetical protein